MTDPASESACAISRAELARRSGRSRSTITEACAGPLAAACLPGGRIDVAHPAVEAWATARGVSLPELRAGTRCDGAPSAPLGARAARRAASSRELVSFDDFACLAGVTVRVVQQAVRGRLRAALRGPKIDLGHPEAIEFMAAFPFERDDHGAVVEELIPEGMLATAYDAERDTVDRDHPRARAFLARMGAA